MRQFTVAMCECSFSNRFHGNTFSRIYIDHSSIYETVPLEDKYVTYFTASMEKGVSEVKVRKEQRKEI
jgi:hypothetical protein